jgi:hypothetical protein
MIDVSIADNGSYEEIKKCLNCFNNNNNNETYCNVVVVSVFGSFFLETVPILYDNNTYTCVYIVVSILDCNYSPKEPTGQGSTAQTFDGKFMSPSLRMFIPCLYGDP